MRDLTDLHFPEAEKIRVVMDNLSTHSPASLYNALPAPEARRILRRLEFHFTPKHASWLNMVEIEIGVLRSQCLDRRISNRERLKSEIAEWERQRNDSGARINWMFSTEKARDKLGRAYPKPKSEIDGPAFPGSTQLIGEARLPIAAEPGKPERFDCEYKRNGTQNLFVFLDVHRPWRKVKVTERRTAADFAACMRDLTDLHFPEAEKIRVVMDNLSTHSPASLYNALPAPEARRILRRLEFHFTPKHASWLNMVEIEIGVLRSQCLDRRIPNRDRLKSEIAEWQRQRNDSGARINWMFSTENARDKLGRAYPKPKSEIDDPAKES